jgi:hypothetical protein
MEIGTLKYIKAVKVAVPLYVVAMPLFVGLPVILKFVIVCIWCAAPFNVTIKNVELKSGELVQFPST